MVRLALAFAVVLTLTIHPANAQSRPIYVQFEPFTVKGALYQPDAGGQADVGVLLIHGVNNYLGHLAARELARRGFVVLAMNSLLKNNGTTVTQIVQTVRPPATLGPEQNASFENGARLLTLKSFLTANAIRSTDAMSDIDWCSSNNSTPCAVKHIGVPLLVSAMGGNTGIRDNEWLYEIAASRDKDFFVLEGATHNIDPCEECERRKGEYNNCVKNFFNYLRDWINRRFMR